MADILVLNAGSSTLKYRLLRGDTTLAGGLVERIGEPGGDTSDHASAVERVLDRLHGKLISAVGHRIVHGGARFVAPVLVDDAVLRELRGLSALAPLHNPPGTAGVEGAGRALPGVPQVAVFDTAFHATLPEAAATYAIDRRVAGAHGIRRYGFHGISVQFVVGRTAQLLDRPVDVLTMVVLHLGNGASATAVAGGRSVETSMGLTPLEGLVMGTRTGDLDPAVTFHLARAAGLSLDEIEDRYQHRSGLAGLCADNDVRKVEARAADGDPAARLALDVFAGSKRLSHAVGTRALSSTTTICGQRNEKIRVSAVRGSGRFSLTVDRP